MSAEVPVESLYTEGSLGFEFDRTLSRLQEMQSKMSDMQEQIAQTEVSGTAGGGMVTVTLSGKGELARAHTRCRYSRSRDN